MALGIERSHFSPTFRDERLREALLAIRGFEGAVGTYNFDENGDGLRGYNIVRNDQGKVIFDRHISFTQ